MQLQREGNPALNTVTAYGNNYVEINRVRYEYAIFFQPEGDILKWELSSPEQITSAELKQLAGLNTASANPLDFLDNVAEQAPEGAPEVILIGTGTKQQFLPIETTRPLLSAGIGIEIMTTPAAARTYNILMSEGRRVMAALLPHQEY